MKYRFWIKANRCLYFSFFEKKHQVDFFANVMSIMEKSIILPFSNSYQICF